MHGCKKSDSDGTRYAQETPVTIFIKVLHVKKGEIDQNCNSKRSKLSSDKFHNIILPRIINLIKTFNINNFFWIIQKAIDTLLSYYHMPANRKT